MTRLLFSVWQLRVTWTGAHSLTTGWVCNLPVQLLLGLARAVTLGPTSLRTQDHIVLSYLRLPQPGRPVPLIYIPLDQCGPVIPSVTGFLFVASYKSQGYDASVSKSKLYYDRQSVGHSVLVSGTHLGTATNFYPSLITFRQLRICLCGAPSLTRSRVCSFQFFFWASPVQHFSDLSPMGFVAIFYYLNYWYSPSLEGQVPVFISPRNRMAQLCPRELSSVLIASYDSQVEVF
jgi:hypothetical protein